MWAYAAIMPVTGAITMATNTKRVASFAEQKQAKLAGAAGLTYPLGDVGTPKFTSVTSMAYPPFEVGDTLSTKQHHVQYYTAALLAAGTKITLSDDDVYSAIQKVSIEGMDDPVDIDNARLQFLDSLQSSNDAPLEASDIAKMLTGTDLDKFAANAITLGQKADKKLERSLAVGIEGKLAWLGSPLIVAKEMERIYGKEALLLFPKVNSRRTNKQRKDGSYHPNEVGMNGNPETNEMTDYFWANVKGKKQIVRFMQLFCEGMPEVHQAKVERETVRALANGQVLPTIPKHLVKYVAVTQGGQAPGLTDDAGLKGVENDLTMSITSHVNRVATAMAMWQVQQAIDEKLSPEVSWEYVDGTPEASATRTKPIQMVARAYVEVKNKKTGATEKVLTEGRPVSGRIAISALIRLGKFVDTCHAQGGTLAKLMQLDKDDRARDKGDKPVVAGTDDTTPMIENVTQLVTSLRATWNYLDTHENSIRLALASPNTAGETAMWLKFMSDKLDTYFTDDKVNQLAAAHNKLMSEGTSKLLLAAKK